MAERDIPRAFRLAARAQGLVRVLGVIELLSVFAVAAAYIYTVAAAYLGDGIKRALMYIAVTAAPFILVCIMRRIINRKRPEEIYDFTAWGIPVSGKTGRSLPSRHTFSAFLIGSVILPGNSALGALVLLFAAYISVYRVISARHFPSDVILGAVLGILLGFFGAFSVTLV